MMQAAVAAAQAVPTEERPLLIAVTVLTSTAPEELRDEMGVARPLEEQVVALAKLAQQAGMDGVVASPREAEAIKAACGSAFLVVTPGIRPDTGVADDQRRTATPAQAMAAGADYIVVGRPITQAADPAGACASIWK